MKHGQSYVHDMRKSAESLTARTQNSVLLGHQITMRDQPWCRAILKGRNCLSGIRDRRSCRLTVDVHGGGRDKQSKYPDRALVRVATTRSRQHATFCSAADACKLFSQRLAGMSSAGDERHLAEVGFNRQRGTPQDC